MSARMLSGIVFGVLLSLPSMLSAQVTNGKKPQLPAPFATKSAGNPPDETQPPQGFLPTVPQGFRVNLFAADFKEPRWLTVAPNGDIFLADSGAGKIFILRDPQHTGEAQQREVFAAGVNRPYGIVFHDDYVYVGATNALLRFHYDPKTSKRLGDAEHLLDLPHGGHWTRGLVFSTDGQHLFISIGSESNINIEKDSRRAAITICDPTGQLWAVVNERDGLGDDLPPDYFTAVKDGGFYGWPYSYIGDNVDPRVNPQKPELVAKAIIPDVLLGSHRAPLQFAFYTGTQFPEMYRGGAFIAEHGSWNRSPRAGYQVAFVPFRDGKPSGDPQPFLTGLVPDPTKATVYGRPVGVAVAPDGALLVSDDSAGLVYRVTTAR
jgi:glucose/arabinose dehydrogenase